ncbi:MAG: proton-conducting transporter membrane subunit [Candidatus Omnitrophota bacterium]|jgi:formate hydrogenlyase subunit 3/multisubunit Na+/H+ antiporter MnhD subunit
MDFKNVLLFDSLSKLVGTFIIFFTAVIFVYSLGFIKTKKVEYYFWFFLTSIASLGVVFSGNLLYILIFWGFLGMALFKLVNLYSDTDADIAKVAKKTFIIVGGSDGFLLFGFLIYIYLTTSNLITGNIIIINTSLSLLSFVFIAIGCFAKAGCMPFHTWVPEVAEKASIPVVAYLPASLDKLLGIYLLARIVKDSFVLDDTAKIILLVAGSLTIICAVMMALIQHNIKKLLGYHAVSQVGYMVIGIACCSPLGLSAGLFHMINHAIYKSCLFLSIGNVEKRAGTAELEQLGGLGKFMPITFITTLIASFSISGIPPLNGFISKWMIYQGLIDFMNSSGSFTLKFVIALSLVLALIGSGLTLASFLKLNSGIFLGNPRKKVKEVRFLLLFTPLVLSILCLIFGIFAYSTILGFIQKSAGGFIEIGLWQPQLATGLIIAGLILGLIIFAIMKKKIRTSASFIGGEELLPEQEVKIGDFYNAIEKMPLLKNIYHLAEEKIFDLYEVFKRSAFLIIRFLRYLHNGILSTYLIWCLLGVVGLFFYLFK